MGKKSFLLSPIYVEREREREREREFGGLREKKEEDSELGCDRVKRIKKRIVLTLLMTVL